MQMKRAANQCVMFGIVNTTVKPDEKHIVSTAIGNAASREVIIIKPFMLRRGLAYGIPILIVAQGVILESVRVGIDAAELFRALINFRAYDIENPDVRFTRVFVLQAASTPHSKSLCHIERISDEFDFNAQQCSRFLECRAKRQVIVISIA